MIDETLAFRHMAFRHNAIFCARYRLLEKIGEGGTGMVFRAACVEPTSREVAVKVLQGGGHGHGIAWRTDPTVLTELNHPCLVKVHACGDLGETPFLEMDFVAGGTLRQAMTPGVAWPSSRAAPVLFALADALAYLHARGLLHLDLKPENVLHAGGGVKLADLDGLVPRGVGRLTWARGSPDYCAPEQRFGLPIDERADVFALAAIGYELLTGRLPSRVFVPGTGIDDALRAGLARDPFDRPATMPDFADLLRAALQPQ